MQKYSVHILFFSAVAMLVSVFFSRAALSVSMMVFITASFIHNAVLSQLRKFITHPFLAGMSFLFLLPLISGLWSTDTNQWKDILRIKLPLLLMPVAFASPFQFSKKQWKALASVFILLVCSGCIWSLTQYIGNASAVHADYLKAKILITPLQNDHVRFSWMIFVAVLLSFYLFVKQKENSLKWLWLIIAVGLVIFLHLLVARTGLISFYIAVLITAIYLLIVKANKKQGLVLLLLIFLFPVLAWFALPSFQNRVRYLLYDFEYFKKAAYLPGGNDAMRIISIKAGWETMNKNPVAGVGFGDIKTETNKWYEAHYPQMIATDKILPSSEWMMYGLGMGWLGFACFFIIMIIPFFLSIKEKLPWWILNATAAFSLMADIGLEVQTGVFLYSFILLWCWKWWNAENTTET